jgi:catechol 2,3-dioxygenase-like lactoylglutathione lyase family enzyme
MQEVVASVSDVKRIVRVFSEIGGWAVRKLPDAPREQWRAWQVPRHCRRIEQWLLVPENDVKGLVRLVKFHGVSQQLMRSSGRAWDTGGIFDVDVFTRDVRRVYRELQAQGWSAYGDPVDYGWGGFDVSQVVATGPDGLVIALLQPKQPPQASFPRYGGFSRVFNSSHMVRDYDATRRWFLDVLGWKYMVEGDLRAVDEPGESIFGLPRPLARDTLRRCGIAHPDGLNDGSLEQIAMPELDGRDFAERCVAPNLGWLAWRFLVPDAQAHALALVARGATLYAEPAPLRLAPYGEVVSFSVRTPDGAILEFFERTARRSD